MRKLLWLLLLPVLAQAAIDPVPVQVSDDLALTGTTLAINGTNDDGTGDDWVTPTSGNLLVVFVGADGNNSSPATIACTGFTTIRAVETSGFRSIGEMTYKVSDGTESSISCTIGSEQDEFRVVAMEFNDTDLDTTLDTSNHNTANSNSASTSTSTNSVTPSTNNALLVACSTQKGAWTNTSWSNSFTSRFDSGTTHVGVDCATRLVTTAGPHSTTVSTTGGSQKNYAAIAAWQESVSTPTTTWTDDTVDPDGSQNISGTLDIALSSAITKMVCSNGDEHTTTTGTPTTNAASFTIDPTTTWVDTGSLNNTELGTAISCYLANASETSTGDNITFNMMASGNGWAIESTCDSDDTPNPCDPDSVFKDNDWTTTVNTGDDVLLVASAGTVAGFSVQGVISGTPPITGEFFTWNETGSVWRALDTLTIPEAAATSCHANVIQTLTSNPTDSPVRAPVCN